MDSCGLFTHILQSCFTGFVAVIWLPPFPCQVIRGKLIINKLQQNTTQYAPKANFVGCCIRIHLLWVKRLLTFGKCRVTAVTGKFTLLLQPHLRYYFYFTISDLYNRCINSKPQRRGTYLWWRGLLAPLNSGTYFSSLCLLWRGCHRMEMGYRQNIA